MRKKDKKFAKQIKRNKKSRVKALLKAKRSGRAMTNKNLSHSAVKPINRAAVLTGRFIGTTKEFGFVAVDNYDDDFFISPKDKLNAFDGDIVEIEPYMYSNGKRREAKVVSIKERSEKKIVGLFQSLKSFGFVIADSALIPQDIYIAKQNFGNATDNDKVVVKLTDYGDSTRKPEGVVVEVLGNADAMGVDVLSVIRDFGVATEFDEKVIRQAENVAKPITDKDIDFREDFRGLLTVTIDGEDSKDLDDAISLERLDDGFRLYVHIADVSNYVQEGSALDKEALKRGTSIYPVDRVIPMLPESLSNGICSLNKGEDRLSLSCIMHFNKSGELIDYDIVESVINVDERLCYNKVAALLNKEDIRLEKNVAAMLKLMKRLAAKLNKNRIKRGSIDFDFKESKIILDENNVAVGIELRDRNVATNIIEEFMLAANETVAYHFAKKDLPFVYRIHEAPDKEKLSILEEICRRLNVSFKIKNDEVEPKEIAKLIKKIKGSDVEPIISKMALRSMQQARYATECIGHFGLASEYYCHFTSPIRRYPDLQIHRIIREELHNKLSSKRIEHYNELLAKVSKSSSELERKSVDIERKTEKIKKAEYMTQFLGEEFDGVISGVTARGIFAELPNTVEGMVGIDTMLDDYYSFDEREMALIGQRTRLCYSLGDKVRIQVAKADKITGNIDFVLVG